MENFQRGAVRERSGNHPPLCSIARCPRAMALGARHSSSSLANAERYLPPSRSTAGDPRCTGLPSGHPISEHSRTGASPIAADLSKAGHSRPKPRLEGERRRRQLHSNGDAGHTFNASYPGRQSPSAGLCNTPAFKTHTSHKNRPTAFGLPSWPTHWGGPELSGVPTPYASF